LQSKAWKSGRMCGCISFGFFSTNSRLWHLLHKAAMLLPSVTWICALPRFDRRMQEVGRSSIWKRQCIERVLVGLRELGKFGPTAAIDPPGFTRDTLWNDIDSARGHENERQE
jgi:hypothetical protein